MKPFTVLSSLLLCFAAYCPAAAAAPAHPSRVKVSDVAAAIRHAGKSRPGFCCRRKNQPLKPQPPAKLEFY